MFNFLCVSTTWLTNSLQWVNLMAFLFLQSHRKKGKSYLLVCMPCDATRTFPSVPWQLLKWCFTCLEKKWVLCEIWGILTIYLLRFPCNIFCFLYRTVVSWILLWMHSFWMFFYLVFTFLFLSVISELIWILTFGYFSSLLEETRLNMLYLLFWNFK